MNNIEKIEELKELKEKLTGYPSKDKTHLKDTKFFERHPIIPSLSISNTMDLLNFNKKNAPAVECLKLRVNNDELKKDAIILSEGLLELGVKPNDIVPVSMPSFYQAVAIFKACNRIGAITTFLNPLASLEEQKRYLNEYEAPILINYNSSQEINEEIKRDTKVRTIITLEKDRINDRTFNPKSKDMIGNTDYLTYHDLKSVGEFYKNKKYRKIFGGNQDALILYTSGSTGEPKSLLFTNKNILASCIYYKNSAHLDKVNDENRRWMQVVPFMYPYGFGASVLATLLAGREAVLSPNIGPNNINEYYSRKPYLVFGSPAFLELTKRNLNKDIDLASLKMFVSGGDFLSVSQSKEGKKFFKEHNGDVEMCNSSGNGETLGCSTNAMNIEYRPETVGQLVNGPKYIVIDPESGKEVKYGEKGVLCTSGKHVFKGYYNNEELTEEVMFNYNGKRYYMTGNYGSLGEDGYFTMSGRASRFFIMNTLNKVYCELVQKVVCGIDVVDSCAVVPKPNAESLYKSKAFVVLKKGIEQNEELKQYIIQKSHEPYMEAEKEIILKEYEIPESVTFIDKLPRTIADKVDYELLRKQAKIEYEQEYQEGKILVKKER